MSKALFIIVVLAGFAVAADEPKVPQFSADQRARFWRVRSEQIAAQSKFEMVVNDLQLTCGASFIVNYDPTGEPACQKAPASKPE